MKRKLNLPKGFNNQNFFDLVSKCLKWNNELAELKKSFDSQQNKYNLNIYVGMYHLTITGQNDCIFFELTKNIDNAEYSISLILEKLNETRNLYVSCETIGGSIGYKRIPPFMLDILRTIANNDFCQSALGCTGSVIYADESNKQEIISRINNYTDSIPMVLAAEYFDTHAYEIDENELAKNLTCFAYVIAADCNFMRAIKNDIKLKSYNGTVTVFTKEESKSYRKEDMYRGVEISPLVFDDISKHSQTIVLPRIRAIEENVTVKPQDGKRERELQEEIQSLKRELDEANQKRKILEKAFNQAKNERFAIVMPDEIYEGEALDLIISAITEYVQNADESQTRLRQLGKEILEFNPRTKNGENYFACLKKILYNGSGLNNSGVSKLRDLGFQIKRNNVHTTYEIAGLQFTTGASPSDDKSGIRFYSDITKSLRVYKLIINK